MSSYTSKRKSQNSSQLNRRPKKRKESSEESKRYLHPASIHANNAMTTLSNMNNCMKECEKKCAADSVFYKKTINDKDLDRDQLSPLTSTFLGHDIKNAQVLLRDATSTKDVNKFIDELNKTYKFINIKKNDIKKYDTVYLQREDNNIFLIVRRNKKVYKSYNLGLAKDLLDLEVPYQEVISAERNNNMISWSGESEGKGNSGVGRSRDGRGRSRSRRGKDGRGRSKGGKGKDGRSRNRSRRGRDGRGRSKGSKGRTRGRK